MMDKKILELTEGNLSQRKTGFFLEGNPEAIGISVEFDIQYSLKRLTNAAEGIDQRSSGKQAFGYSYPVLRGRDIARVWGAKKSRSRSTFKHEG